MFKNLISQGLVFFKKFVSTSFLFDTPQLNSVKSILPLVIIFGSLIISGFLIWLILSLVKKNHPIFKMLREKIFWCLETSGFLGMLVLFFRFQGLRIGSRFFILIIFLIFLIWIGSIFKYIIGKMPQELLLYQEDQRKSKYLPKKKK